MHVLKKTFLSAILLCLIAATGAYPIGQSAVITLVFPPGARATGLGEAFVGLADDANATFFNPAGLGQAPLANAWKAFTVNGAPAFTAIASKKAKEFSLKEKIWAGTTHGLLQFDGSSWISFEKYLIVQDDSPLRVVKKYLSVDNEAIIRKAVMKLKAENGIEAKRSAALASYLRREVSDSTLKAKGQSIDDICMLVLDLPKTDRTPAKIYGTIAAKVDSLKANAMSDEIAKLLAVDDVSFDDLVELKVPFSIAVDDSVTALTTDSLDRIWIGTPRGLWRYDGATWTLFTAAEGLPSNFITSLCAGSEGRIAAGTDQGVGIYADGKFSAPPGQGTSAAISAVAFGRAGTLYCGTNGGVLVQKDSAWTTLDSTHGLLSSEVTALLFDSRDRLWIGSKKGVTIYDESSWKRFKFPESVVRTITEYKSGVVWIGTDKGAVSYTPGKTGVDKTGKKTESPAEWKTVHSKNGLKGDDVRGIAIHGNDIWVATSNAINLYDYAEKQALTFLEQLLPAFKIPDLWHVYFAGVWPTDEWGTLGLSVNFINFGQNEWTDENGKIKGRARSWEGVFGLSYGLSLMQDLSLGINLKYAYSALAPGYGSGDEGIGQTFAADVGLLKRNLLLKNLDFGVNFQNMGPAIFYVSQEEKDPIPFTIKLGTAYHAIQTPIHNVTLLLDLDREIVKNYFDKPPDPFYKAIWTDLINDTTALSDTLHSRLFNELEEINLHAGIEWWYANFLALRIGHLFDYIGKRFELTLGLGFRYGNLNIDWSFIHSPEGFMKGIVSEGSNGSRNGQMRFSLIFKL
jgi:ligand-binding sensor domain-containing protein